MSKSEQEQVDEILAEYFTWRGEAIHEVSQTANYQRMKSKLLNMLREARINELITEHGYSIPLNSYAFKRIKQLSTAEERTDNDKS